MLVPRTMGGSPWNVVAASPVSHVFAIQSFNPDVSHIGAGNTVGIFNSENQCSGYMVFGEGNSLMGFMDDPTTEQIDGLAGGEVFSLRLYKASTMLSYELTASYDKGLPVHNGTFAPNGLSAITGFKVGELIVDEHTLKAVEMFPNPTSDILTINNVLPLDLEYNIQSIRGNGISGGTLQQGSNSIDMTGLESGVYLITITTGEKSLTRRVIKN